MEIIPTDIIKIIFKKLDLSDFENVALTCARFAFIVKQHFASRIHFERAKERFPVVIGYTHRTLGFPLTTKILVTKNSKSISEKCTILCWNKDNGNSIYGCNFKYYSKIKRDVSLLIFARLHEYGFVHKVLQLISKWNGAEYF